MLPPPQTYTDSIYMYMRARVCTCVYIHTCPHSYQLRVWCTSSYFCEMLQNNCQCKHAGGGVLYDTPPKKGASSSAHQACICWPEQRSYST